MNVAVSVIFQNSAGFVLDLDAPAPACVRLCVPAGGAGR